MSSGDTIKSGSQRAKQQSATPRSHRDIQPKPFIPKRPPPVASVYSEDDYDANGKLKVLRKVPLGEKYNDKRSTAMMGTTERADYHRPPVMQQPPPAAAAPATQVTTSKPAKVAVSKEDAARLPPLAKGEAYSSMPGKPDVFSVPPTKHRLGKNKFDLQTPEGMANRDEQYIAVVRTIENRHPDEDRLLQKYALQYIARQNGTYNPIDDPPVILSDLVPTCCVVIDRIFSRDEAMSDQKAVSKYVKKLADRTDLDVVPVYVTKPFHVPLHPMTAFKYKDEVIGQIMQEFYDSKEESASEILERVEADREGRPRDKAKWHVYDGVSPQGAFGPKTAVRVLDDNEDHENDGDENAAASTQSNWGDRPDNEKFNESEYLKRLGGNDGKDEDGGNDDADEDDDEDEEETKNPTTGWTTVKPAGKRGGARRPVRAKK